MMYVKYKLREPTALVVPKGPSFFGARTIKTKIDDTQISFKVPKHRPIDSSHDPKFPAKTYSSKKINFDIHREEELKVPYDWEVYELFDHAWTFYGPWFTGMWADLTMYVNLVKPVNYPNMNFSLFLPRAFEQLVGDYLTYCFSGTRSSLDDWKCYSMAPVDWQPYDKLSVMAARLKVVSDPTVIYYAPKYYLFFPIDDHLMVAINLTPSQLIRGTEEERNKRVSLVPVLEMLEKIIESLQVKLSPEAIAKQQAAVKGLEDTSLVKEYPPFNWNDPEFLAKTMKQFEESPLETENIFTG